MTWFTRRSMLRLAGATTATGMLRPYRGFAADKSVTIGIDLSLTGAEAETAIRIRDGFINVVRDAAPDLLKHTRHERGWPAQCHLCAQLG